VVERGLELQHGLELGGYRTTPCELEYRCPIRAPGSDNPVRSRLIDVRLLVGTSGKPVEVQSSLSGRNTEYGYDPNVCNPIPP